MKGYAQGVGRVGIVRSAGRSTTMGNTTYYYNANGSSAGRSTTMGNTTYYYGPDGASAGTATRSGW